MAKLVREVRTTSDMDTYPKETIVRHYVCCDLGFDQTIEEDVMLDSRIDTDTSLGAVEYCPRGGERILR